MTNLTCILVISLLIAMDIVIVIISLVQRGMGRVSNAFFGLSLCVIGWLASDLAYFVATDEAAIMYLLNLKFPFVAFAPVAMLILVLRFYRADKMLTIPFRVLLCVIPIITTVLAITSPLHSLIRAEQVLISAGPLRDMVAVRGVWFWIHAAYCYLLVVASVVVVIARHKTLPSGYRASSVVMLIAMVINVACNAVSIMYSSPLDISLIGMGACLIFIYVASVSGVKTDLLEIARDEIFNYLDEYVFILNLQQQVVEANLTGRNWLAQLGIALEFPFPFARVFAALRGHGATIHENAEERAGTDIYYSQNDRGVVYNMTERFVRDKKNRPIGVYTTFVDITRYKEVIDQLEKAVEIDPLTGIASRRFFENQKQLLAAEQPEVLSVVLGDANGLKQVNDTLGHQQGDVLLRVLAQQLRQCSPEGTTPARIGGDEFALILPGLDLAAAQEFIACVELGLAGKTAYDFTPSIALGAAQLQPGESIENMVHRADVGMYQRKKYDRRQGRGPKG